MCSRACPRASEWTMLWARSLRRCLGWNEVTGWACSHATMPSEGVQTAAQREVVWRDRDSKAIDKPKGVAQKSRSFPWGREELSLPGTMTVDAHHACVKSRFV